MNESKFEFLVNLVNNGIVSRFSFQKKTKSDGHLKKNLPALGRPAAGDFGWRFGGILRCRLAIKEVDSIMVEDAGLYPRALKRKILKAITSANLGLSVSVTDAGVQFFRN